MLATYKSIIGAVIIPGYSGVERWKLGQWRRLSYDRSAVRLARSFGGRILHGNVCVTMCLFEGECADTETHNHAQQTTL